MKAIQLFKLVFFSIILVSTISSCKKDEPKTPEEQAKSKEKILTSKTGWKLDEIRYLIDVNLHYYHRYNRSNNTDNSDNDIIVFKDGGTGTYSFGATGAIQTYPITWSFTNAEKTKMVIAITFTPTITLTLYCSDVEVAENMLFMNAYYTDQNGNNIFQIARRTPVTETVPISQTSNPSNSEQILSQRTGGWKLNTIRYLTGNLFSYYQRGAVTGNTINSDDDIMFFNSNGSGSYSFRTTGPIQTYPISWVFKNSEKTKMEITINFSGLLVTLYCNDVEISDTDFFLNAYYINPATGKYILQVARRAP